MRHSKIYGFVYYSLIINEGNSQLQNVLVPSADVKLDEDFYLDLEF